MIKRRHTRATSRSPLRPIADESLVRVTAGTGPSIDVDPPGPVAQMREIVHIQ